MSTYEMSHQVNVCIKEMSSKILIMSIHMICLEKKSVKMKCETYICTYILCLALCRLNIQYLQSKYILLNVYIFHLKCHPILSDLLSNLDFNLKPFKQCSRASLQHLFSFFHIIPKHIVSTCSSFRMEEIKQNEGRNIFSLSHRI